MIVFHVTSAAKFERYRRIGRILPPVRAWDNIIDAERFSLSTGRHLILRLRADRKWKRLPGHFGRALVCEQPVPVEGF